MARSDTKSRTSDDTGHCVQLVDLTAEYLCVLRRDGTMAMANPALRRFLGFPPELFVSTPPEI